MVNEICSVLGLPFNDDMINWKDAPRETFHKFGDSIFTQTVQESSGFHTGHTSRPVDMSSLPDVVLKAKDDAEPYYRELYHLRLVLKNEKEDFDCSINRP